jgi:hypothetical protein
MSLVALDLRPGFFHLRSTPFQPIATFKRAKLHRHFSTPYPSHPKTSTSNPCPSLLSYYNLSKKHTNFSPVGLDVDLTSGIIAAAQESTYSLSPRVQLLSLTTGAPLYSPSVNKEYLLPPRPGSEELAARKSQKLTTKDNALSLATARRNMRGQEQKGGVRYRTQANPPRCVKWNEDVEGQMKSLYVSDDTGTISRYVWGGKRGDEEDWELPLVR